MKKIALTTALILAASVAAAEEPMGICITNIECLAEGYAVDFVTDLPPPYRVGIHVPEEIGLVRAWPVAYVDTSDTHVVVTGKFYDVATFIQVYKVTPRICPRITRQMSDAEWRVYVRNVHATPTRKALRNHPTDNPPDLDINGVQPNSFILTGDKTWRCFVYTNATDYSFAIETVDWHTNKLSEAITVKDRDPSVGTGFRIIANEQDEGIDVTIQAAYSALPDMSQPVLVKRGWKSLSSNGAWIMSTDWLGAPVMVPCTNAVPYRIYGEGL